MIKNFEMLIGITLLCGAECVEIVGPPQYGQIEFSAFDPAGQSMPEAQISLIELGTKKDVSSSIKERTAMKVPYGWYKTRFAARGFQSVERTFRLDQPQSHLRVQMPLAVQCGGLDNVTGVIKSSQKRDMWVKFVPLRGIGDGAEAHVRPDGSFVASALVNGQYLMLVLDGNAVVHSETLDVPTSRSLITVTLKKTPE